MDYILIVENDHANVETMEMVLAEEGYKVVGTSTCAKALNAVKKLGPPRLAIIDYYLDYETCVPCADQLHRSYPLLPIILCTAAVHPERLMPLCHAKGLLVKPFSLEDFLSTVRHEYRAPGRTYSKANS